MHRALKSLAVLGLLGIAIVPATTASADASADADSNDDSPELRVVSVVHGMSFALNQREVVPGTQGPTTMITHIHAAIPPGPPQIDLVVRVTAPDMEVAHAAGALTAIGLMHGIPLQQITDTFAQLNWGVQIKSVKGQVDQNLLIDGTKAGALAELTISAIIAGDRPGGGCDAAIPFIEQGAAALGFAPTCALQ